MFIISISASIVSNAFLQTKITLKLLTRIPEFEFDSMNLSIFNLVLFILNNNSGIYFILFLEFLDQKIGYYCWIDFYE